VKMGAINPAWLWAYFIILAVIFWLPGFIERQSLISQNGIVACYFEVPI